MQIYVAGKIEVRWCMQGCWTIAAEGETANLSLEREDETLETDTAMNKQEATAKSERHAEKAIRGKETAMVEMWNAKNAYLLSIEVSNRMLHKYFKKDLPSIHDVSFILLEGPKDTSLTWSAPGYASLMDDDNGKIQGYHEKALQC